MCVIVNEKLFSQFFAHDCSKYVQFLNFEFETQNFVIRNSILYRKNEMEFPVTFSIFLDFSFRPGRGTRHKLYRVFVNKFRYLRRDDRQRYLSNRREISRETSPYTVRKISQLFLWRGFQAFAKILELVSSSLR